MPDDSTRAEWEAAIAAQVAMARTQPRYTRAQIFPEAPKDIPHMIQMIYEVSKNPPVPLHADANSIDEESIKNVKDAYKLLAIAIAADTDYATDKNTDELNIPDEITSDPRFVWFSTKGNVLAGYRDENLGLEEETIQYIVNTHSEMLGRQENASKGKSLSH